MEVKPFLVIDRTENDDNRFPNGVEYNVADVSQETFNEWNLLHKTKAELDKRLRLPLILLYLPYFFLLLGFASTLETLSHIFGKRDITDQVYFLIVLISAVIGYGLYFLLPRLYKLRCNKLTEKEEFKHCLEKGEALAKKSRKELNVPDSFISADILFFHYKLIDGKVTPISQNKKQSPYENSDYLFYIQNNIFCVATAFDSFAVPLEAMQRIRKVEENVKISAWNKAVPPTDVMYNKYIESVDGKHIKLNHYYILEFSHNGILWGLYFPPYELSVFEKLTGLKAEKNN